mgnify:CR=1 FL=1
MTIEARSITMQYTLKTALDGVSVTFGAGKIHALLGENGAGKSTLAGVISGAIVPTAGTLLVDGERVRFSKPRDALERGIVLVRQRPLLSTALTARENIRLQLKGRANAKAALGALDELCRSWSPSLPLDVAVRDLGGNHRFYSSLLGALLLRPRFLLLDEPSAFLDLDERRTLYERLRDASLDGMTVLVITHSSAEAATYADTVTVLKRGTLFRYYADAAQYREALAAESVDVPHGEQVQANVTHAGTPQAISSRASMPQSTSAGVASTPRPCFVLSHASCRPKNRPALLDAELCACYGEITAVSGLKEAALDTLEDLVTGMQTDGARGTAQLFPPPATQAAADADARALTLQLARGALTARFLRRHHTAIVPSERTFRASNPALTVEQMLCACTPTAKTAALADALIAQAGVNITRREKAANLSGGMLQRLILARELSAKPDFVILCNPLQGLDLRGQREMTARIVQLAAAGKAVLLVGAADFPLSLCARVYALESGVCKLSFAKSALEFAL